MITFPHQILHHVCESLISPDTDGPLEARHLGPQTVLSLARTCRDFHDHAVDVLWHTIPSVALLIYTLPRDTWDVVEWSEPCEDGPDGHPEIRVKMTLRRPLEYKDPRWSHYAHRVIRISVDLYCNPFPERARLHDPDLLFTDALTSFFPHGSLLPNLETCNTFQCIFFGLYRTLPVLFGPKLQNFYHCCIYTSSEFDSVENGYTRMLAKLRERSLSLIRLALSTQPCSPRLADNVLRDLFHWQTLRLVLLDAIPVTLPALLHLSMLKYLESLHVTLSPDLHEDASMPCREHLTVCTAIVRLVRSKILRDIDVECDTHHSPSTAPTTVSDIRDFSTALADAPFQPVLVHIVLQLDVLTDPPQLALLINDTFSGLLRLAGPTLDSLEPDICHPFAIDDALVVALAHAFPNLHCLALGTTRPYTYPDSEAHLETHTTAVPALRALLALASHCPKLRTLGLTFDPHTPAVVLHAEERLGEDIMHTTLWTLRVGRSLIDVARSEPLSAFLSDIFYELLVVEYGWVATDADLDEDEDKDVSANGEERERQVPESERHYRDGLERVDVLAQVLAEIRDVERNWAACRHQVRSVSATSSCTESNAGAISDSNWGRESVSDPDSG